jgi:hypothetical protein
MQLDGVGRAALDQGCEVLGAALSPVPRTRARRRPVWLDQLPDLPPDATASLGRDVFVEGAGCSSEVEHWLGELGRRGWLIYLFGRDRWAPSVMAAVWQWPDHADVIVIVDEQTATAYRALTCPDVFAPRLVTWVSAGELADILRDMLNLPVPADDADSAHPMTPPPGCGVPPEVRRVTHVLPGRSRG